MPGGPGAPPAVLLDWKYGDHPRGVRAAPILTVFTVVMGTLSLTITLSRLYDRVKRHSTGVDDALIAFAVVCYDEDVSLHGK